MRRGYAYGRDNRRQVLADGLQEHPAAVAGAQMFGGFSSPIKPLDYAKTAPLSVKSAANFHNAMAAGLAYGVGSGQDNWQNYALHTLAGLTGNGLGHKLTKQAFGRAAAPAVSKLTNTMSGQAADYGLDEFSNWYNNYNKF